MNAVSLGHGLHGFRASDERRGPSDDSIRRFRRLTQIEERATQISPSVLRLNAQRHRLRNKYGVPETVQNFPWRPQNFPELPPYVLIREGHASVL